MICTVLTLELKKKICSSKLSFDSESLSSHPSLFKLQTDWILSAFLSVCFFSLIVLLFCPLYVLSISLPHLSLLNMYSRCIDAVIALFGELLLLLRPVVVGKVKCCNCINVNMWGDVHCCILWAKYWWFTKRDLLQDNLLRLFCHIRAHYNFCMLTLTLNCVLSWILDFYRVYWRLCLVNYTILPIDFKISFFILFSYSILVCRPVVNLPQWIFLVYAFLISVQMYLKCLYKWTLFCCK